MERRITTSVAQQVGVQNEAALDALAKAQHTAQLRQGNLRVKMQAIVDGADTEAAKKWARDGAPEWARSPDTSVPDCSVSGPDNLSTPEA